MRSSFARSLVLLVSVLGGVSTFSHAADAAPDGKALFLQNCASCHGTDGKAASPMAKRLGVRDLTALSHTEAEVQKAVVDGMKNAKGVLVMRSFKDQFTAEELAAVVQYVKSLQKK